MDEQVNNDETNGGLRQRTKDSSPDGATGTELIEVDVDTERMSMGRNVGLISGISLIVGSIIGSGIFISPKGVLSDTGSVGLSLIVWAASGLIALMGALSYAELGTLIRLSGGEYAYIRAGLGNICAYLYAWTSVIVIRPSTVAIICLVFAEYVASFFKMCGQPQIPNKLVAAVALTHCFLISLLITTSANIYKRYSRKRIGVTVGIVNSWSVKLAARVQVVFTAAKLIALIIIIIGGIIKMAQGSTEVLATGFEGTVTTPSIIALAFYGALWAYDGWNNLNYVTEEIKEPRKNLPRANIIGVMLVTIVYILTNISYLAVLSKQQLLGSPAVAVTWGDLVLGVAAIIMPLSVMISTFGAANGTAFSGARVVYAAARDNNLPEVLSYIQVNQLTPMPSMVFTIFISLLMIIPGDIASLIDFFSFTAWLFYGLTFLSLLVLRFTMKNEERAYKVPFPIPLLMFLISIYLVIAPIVDSPQIEFLYAFLFVIGGLILYFPFVHFNLKLPGWDHFTMYCQLIFNIVPSSVEPDE